MAQPTFRAAETTIKKGNEHIPLSILSLNAQGLYSKFALFQAMIEEHNPDIIAVTETWLDASISDSEFTPQGYVIFRKDRNINHYAANTYRNENRGGVLMMVKSELKATRYTRGEVNAEIMWIQINPHPKAEWLYGVCYRPEVDEEEMLNRINQSINLIDIENTVLLGDFNFRNIDWQEETCTRTIEQNFIDTINDNLLTQIVTEPTRGDNILDLAFVADHSQVLSCSTSSPLGSSDHKIIKIEMKLPVQRISSEPRKIYLYSKRNYEAMNSYFLDTEWDSLLQATNVEENWRIFKERYHEAMEKFIPHKTVKAGQRLKLPWTRYRSVKKARKHHRSLQVNQKKSQLFADGLLELEAKRNIDQAILKAKAHYENKIVEQSKENPKRFWNYTRHFTKSSSTIDVLEKEDTKVTDDKEKAEMLNNFFSSVLTDEPPDLPNFDSTPTPEFILKDFEITTPMIRKKMSKLKTNKASGPDNISVNIMKECLNLDEPLKIIFTQSLQTGQVPQEWRDANITPLFKKGNRASPLYITTDLCP